LREKGVRKIPGVVSWSSVKGRNGYDNKAVKEAAIAAALMSPQSKQLGSERSAHLSWCRTSSWRDDAARNHLEVSRMTSAKIIPLHVSKSEVALFCTACGAERHGSCHCGAGYAPVGDRAAASVAANREKSDRAIAEEIGTGSQGRWSGTLNELGSSPKLKAHRKGRQETQSADAQGEAEKGRGRSGSGKHQSISGSPNGRVHSVAQLRTISPQPQYWGRWCDSISASMQTRDGACDLEPGQRGERIPP